MGKPREYYEFLQNGLYQDLIWDSGNGILNMTDGVDFAGAEGDLYYAYKDALASGQELVTKTSGEHYSDQVVDSTVEAVNELLKKHSYGTPDWAKNLAIKIDEYLEAAENNVPVGGTMYKPADSYVFTGSETTAVEGTRVPIVYGEVMVNPVTASYVKNIVEADTVGLGDQSTSTSTKAIVKVIDVVSEGEIEGPVGTTESAMYLGGSPLDNGTGTSFYSDGTIVQWLSGASDQGQVTGFNGSYTLRSEIITFDLDETGSSPRVKTIPAGTDAVSMVLQFTEGLGYTGEGGNPEQYSVTVTVEAKLASQLDTEYKVMSVTPITKNCPDVPFQKTVLAEDLATTVGTGEAYDLRITRSIPDGSITTLKSTIQVAEIYSIKYDKLSYANTAVFCSTFDASGFEGSIPHRTYLIKGKKVKIPKGYTPPYKDGNGVWQAATYPASWDFTSFETVTPESPDIKYVYTSNPVWIYYDLLTNERYGLGLDDKYIDLEKFYEISQHCDELIDAGTDPASSEPRYKFNGTISGQMTAEDALGMVASSFLGKPIWMESKTSLMCEYAPTLTNIAVPANVIGGNFTYSTTSFKNRYTAVRVVFRDEILNYTLNSEVVEADASWSWVKQIGYKEFTVKAPGCTTRSQAHRFGKWILHTQLEQSILVSYTASFDHADIMPGDLVYIADNNLTSDEIGGRVSAVTDTTVTLDRALTEQLGTNPIIGLTSPDGSVIVKPISVHSIVDNKSVVTVGTMTAEEKPNVGSVWGYYDDAMPRTVFKVIYKKEVGRNMFAIKGMMYVENKFTDIDAVPVITKPVPVVPSIPKPINLTAVPFTYPDGQDLNAPTKFGVDIKWEMPTDPAPEVTITKYKIQAWTADTMYEPTYSDVTSVKVKNVPPQTYHLKVKAIAGERESAWTILETPVTVDNTASLVGNASNVRLKTGVGATANEFITPDCSIEWDAPASTLFLTAYSVEVFDQADLVTPIHTERVVSPTTEYTFSMTKNVGKVRALKFIVKSVDKLGNASAGAEFSVENKKPTFTSDPTAVATGMDACLVSWGKSNDEDIVNYKISGRVTGGPADAWFHEYVDKEADSKVYSGLTENSYDVTVTPCDSFGEGDPSSILTVIPTHFGDLLDVEYELVKSITMTDSKGSTNEQLSVLYDKRNDTGITYSTGGFIQYEFPVEYIVDRVAVVPGTTSDVYVSYSKDEGVTWNYLKAVDTYQLGDLCVQSNTNDGNTTFTDSSINNLSIANSGTPTHSTTQEKFGASSMYFTVNDTIVVTNDGSFDCGTGDFTVDYWLWKSSHSVNDYHFDIGANGTYVRSYSNSIELRTAANGLLLTAAAPTTSTWVHIAFVRHNGTTKLYYDGVEKTSTSTVFNFGSASDLAIGNYGGLTNYSTEGYIDEFRFTKGRAVWTENFTPPTASYVGGLGSVSDIPLGAAADEADAQANCWSLTADVKNAAIFPDAVAGTKFRLHMTGNTIINELVFAREVIAEFVAAENLQAISADLGEITAGKLSSKTVGSDSGIVVDLNNDRISLGGNHTEVSTGSGWLMEGSSLKAYTLGIETHGFINEDNVAWQRSTDGSTYEPIDSNFTLSAGDVVLGAYNYKEIPSGNNIGGLFWDQTAGTLHVRGLSIENTATGDSDAANKAYVDAAIAALVDSSPTTLDTLNELAAALGDDPNFATTMTDLIGTKLDATARAADSEKLDGLDSTQFLRRDVDTAGKKIYAEASYNVIGTDMTSVGQMECVADVPATAAAAITFRRAGMYAVNFGLDPDNQLKVGGFSMGANSYKIWHEGNDGAGSGLDADKLDNLDSSQFLRSDTADTAINVTLSGTTFFVAGEGLEIKDGGSRSTTPTLGGHTPNDTRKINLYDGNVGTDGALLITSDVAAPGDAADELLYIHPGYFEWKGNTIWHAGNDGSGSGLDADKLDGLDSSKFHRSDQANSGYAVTTYNGNGLRFWNSSNYSIYMSAQGDATWGGRLDSTSDYNMYFKMTGGTNRGFVFKNGTTDIFQIEGSGQVRTTGDLIVDGGTDTAITVLSDDLGKSEIALYGNAQGTGRVYVGQSSTYGGGIEYNGDSNPVTSGAGADYIALYRRDVGVDSWTARNSYHNDNWEFRADVKSATFNATSNIYVNGTAVSLEGHGHSISNVTGLQTALDGKANTHSHPYLGSTANAVSASKLATARTISLTGDATGSTSFDGSGNASIAVTIDGANHTHSTLTSTTVNATTVNTNTISCSGEMNIGGVPLTMNLNVSAVGTVVIPTGNFRVNSGAIWLDGGNFKIGGTSGTTVNIPNDNPGGGSTVATQSWVNAQGFGGTYTHPSTKQCTYSYTHPSTKQCSYSYSHPSTQQCTHSHSGYLTTTGKAADSEKLDGIDSSGFVRVGATVYDSTRLNGWTWTQIDDYFDSKYL